MRLQNQISMFAIVLLSGASIFALGRPAGAAAVTAYSYERADEMVIGENESRISLFGGKFTGGATNAAADVNGDGKEDVIAGAGRGGGPQVEVYSQSGRKLQSFFTLDHRMTAGINVAAGDLDGDGQAEIVVAPQSNYRPVVEIYQDGVLIDSFLAFESSYTGGVRLAVIPSRGDQPAKILAASSEAREPEIRMFNWEGGQAQASWFPFGHVLGNGVSIAAGWSDAFNQNVLVVGAPAGRVPEVKVIGLSSTKTLASWLAYDRKAKVGVDVAFAGDRVITGPLGFGSSEIRSFSVTGKDRQSFFAYEMNFRGGVRVGAMSALTGVKAVVTPGRKTELEATGKKIEIILSKQELRMYERGTVISTRRVSTGKWSMPTPTGTFKTRNKIPVAYSRAYGLYMEYWMAVTADGKIGLHALPFWKLKNGGKLYEGANHIGTPVSHGCIRQTVADAKSLFDWAPIGTPVIIKR